MMNDFLCPFNIHFVSNLVSTEKININIRSVAGIKNVVCHSKMSVLYMLSNIQLVHLHDKKKIIPSKSCVLCAKNHR